MVNMETQNAEQVEGLDASPADMGDYPIDSLLIRSENRTIFEVVRRINQQMYIMDPDFQRDFVWDREKQSRLIESVLMRIPLPVIYMAENPDGRLVIVDGLQRLTTFARFMSNELQLMLQNPELSNRTFSQLSPKLQNRIEDASLILYLIDAKAPERARLDIFERVNSGVPLTRQQMRNCLYQGEATRLLKVLALDPTFIQVTGKSLDQKSMRDREAINRFFGFHLLGAESYRDDMDQFLAEALTTLNKKNAQELEDLKAAFLRSMRNNAVVFEKHAFRKHEAGEQRRMIFNMSLFDVFSTGLARYDEDLVKAQAQLVHKGFFKLMQSQDFVTSITYGTNSRKAVEARFRMVGKLLHEVFGAV